MSSGYPPHPSQHIERDLAHVRELGCTPTLALNTHVHADHVTGSGQLKQTIGGLRSCISKASGATADVLLSPGDVVTWGGGQRQLKVRVPRPAMPTPPLISHHIHSPLLLPFSHLPHIR